MNVLSPQWTLLIGIGLSLFVQGSEVQNIAKKWSGKLLQLSVILLGASLNFYAVLNQGSGGVLITFLSILTVFMLGYVGLKVFKVDYEQGLLITMGTAICGGSAIGALAPVIKAGTLAITVSISIVFLLNAIAVFAFPFIGNFFELTQDQFGLWSALAIHDTSSVVAASTIYGSRALEIATTVKLLRALWIIPITLFFSLYVKNNDNCKITIPWFIIGFILVSMLFTFTDIDHQHKLTLNYFAKIGFSITLFLIGLNFDFKLIRSISVRPLLLGFSLWVTVSFISLVLIKQFS